MVSQVGPTRGGPEERLREMEVIGLTDPGDRRCDMPHGAKQKSTRLVARQETGGRGQLRPMGVSEFPQQGQSMAG